MMNCVLAGEYLFKLFQFSHLIFGSQRRKVFVCDGEKVLQVFQGQRRNISALEKYFVGLLWVYDSRCKVFCGEFELFPKIFLFLV